MLRHSYTFAAAIALLAVACTAAAPSGPAAVCGYEVVASYPHDTNAYTQGLDIHDGRLFESTGLNGRSTLREVDLESGLVVRELELAVEYFAEGMTILGDRAYQLTWQSGTGFVYDVDTFGLARDWKYEGEGWGLTDDGSDLIMSNGSATLRFLDPHTFTETRRINVADGGEPVDQLNELEYVDGQIWANVWQSERVARIDPRTGTVLAWLDLAGVLSAAERTPTAEVLNGIAHDANANRVFVTGKLWPRLYEIRADDCPV